MSENGQDCARAYVGSPVTAESGVFLAIRWAFALDHSLGWNSIGLIIADPEQQQPLSHLDRLRSRGARIGTIDQALTTRSFSGVMIAYRPDPQTLARTQDISGSIGIVALAADRNVLQPWVDAYHPKHLGGEVITATPDPPQAGPLEQILASYTTGFTTRTGPLTPNDQQVLVEVIQHIRRNGYPRSPQTLLAIALRAGWPGHAAWALHRLAARWDALKATGSPRPAQHTPSA